MYKTHQNTKAETQSETTLVYMYYMCNWNILTKEIMQESQLQIESYKQEKGHSLMQNKWTQASINYVRSHPNTNGINVNWYINQWDWRDNLQTPKQVKKPK